MAALLSPEWVASLAEASAGAEVPQGVRLVLQQVVVDEDGSEVAYAVRLHDGAVEVEPGRAPDADVTFTQDRATAEAIAAGTLSAQAAFLAGRLRVGGDLTAVLEGARDLTGIGDVFAGARDGTKG
jgi:predicted lipid carrier protein YhbT